MTLKLSATKEMRQSESERESLLFVIRFKMKYTSTLDYLCNHLVFIYTSITLIE